MSFPCFKFRCKSTYIGIYPTAYWSILHRGLLGLSNPSYSKLNLVSQKSALLPVFPVLVNGIVIHPVAQKPVSHPSFISLNLVLQELPLVSIKVSWLCPLFSTLIAISYSKPPSSVVGPMGPTGACWLLSSHPYSNLFSHYSQSVIFSKHKPDHLIAQKLLIVLMWLSPYVDPGLLSSFIFPHSLALHSTFQVDLRTLCSHSAFH